MFVLGVRTLDTKGVLPAWPPGRHKLANKLNGLLRKAVVAHGHPKVGEKCINRREYGRIQIQSRRILLEKITSVIDELFNQMIKWTIMEAHFQFQSRFLHQIKENKRLFGPNLMKFYDS